MKTLLLSLISLFLLQTSGAKAIESGCLGLVKDFEPIDRRPLLIEEINYRVVGDNREDPIVLIHGLDSAWQTFANVIEPLSKDHMVIVYDQRGSGQSSAGGVNFSSTLLAQDLLVLLNHLKIKKINVLGHSMGAKTAVRFAATYPDRIKSVIIEDFELQAREKDTLDNLAQVEVLAFEARKVPEDFPSVTAAAKALRPLFHGQAAYLAKTRTEILHSGRFKLLFRPSVSFLYGYQSNVENLLGPFSQITAPILVMEGNPKKGSAISPHGLTELKQAQPKAQYSVFDTGHVIHREDPTGYLSKLESFLGEHH